MTNDEIESDGTAHGELPRTGGCGCVDESEMNRKSYLIGFIEGPGADGVRYLQENVTFLPRGTGNGTEPLICIGGAIPHDAGGCFSVESLLRPDAQGPGSIAKQVFSEEVGAWFLPLAQRLAAGDNVEDREVEAAYAEAHGGLPIKTVSGFDVFVEMGVVNWLRRVDAEPRHGRPPPLPSEVEVRNERLYCLAERHGEIVVRRAVPPGEGAVQAACYLTGPDRDGCQASLLLSRELDVCTVTFPWRLNEGTVGLLEQRLREEGFYVIPFGFFIARAREIPWREIAVALQPASQRGEVRNLVHREAVWQRFFGRI